MDTIVVDSLANHPDMISQVTDMVWAEWGEWQRPGERERWLRLYEEDARLHSQFSAAFVALDQEVPVGVVQLHEFDIEEMEDRSPWICGMLVHLDYRDQGIGRRLLAALELFAAGRGVEQLWVFTESAAAFYEKCGWCPHTDVVSNGEEGRVLTKHIVR